MKKRFSSYKDYLASTDWLILKAKLVYRFIRRSWKIRCFVCGGETKLQVHHFSYKGLWKKDEIEDLDFICKGCHQKWYFERGFKKKWEDELWADIFDKFKINVKS